MRVFAPAALTGFAATGLTGFAATGLTGFAATGLTGFAATGLTGFAATGLTGFAATGLTGFAATGLTGFAATGLTGFAATGLTGFAATGLTGFAATGLTGFAATGLTGFAATGLTGFAATGLTGFAATGLTGFAATGLTILLASPGPAFAMDACATAPGTAALAVVGSSFLPVLLDNLINIVGAPAVGWLAWRIAGLLRVQHDDRLVRRLEDGMLAALDFGREMAARAGSNLSDPDTQRRIVSDAAGYLAPKMPDTLKRLGIPEAGLRDRLTARIGAVLPPAARETSTEPRPEAVS